jgi:eukaryotic-like serine/threonine-protein kinase
MNDGAPVTRRIDMSSFLHAIVNSGARATLECEPVASESSVGARVANSSAPPLRPVGRYVLHDAFASGGMATVHFARLVGQQGFSRTVAVKRLYPHFARDREFVGMFVEEARLLSRIRHPNVVAPLDVVVLEADLWIVMEYVHGQAVSLLAKAQQGPISPAIASAIVVQLLLGLHAVHEATSETGTPLGIVHRDVSPQNVLVDVDGLARLVDFGIAKAMTQAQTRNTSQGLLKGKLGYLAPEQVRQERVDRRTDVYTAGIVLWELLTGRRLFACETPAATFHAIASGHVVPPSAHVSNLSAPLCAVVMRALSANIEHRFSDARAMAIALADAVPPTSTLELGSWVEALARHELKERAQRILEIESLHSNVANGPPAATTSLQSTMSIAPANSLGPARPHGADAPGSTTRPVQTERLSRPEPSRTQARKLRPWMIAGTATSAVLAATVLGLYGFGGAAAGPGAPAAAAAKPHSVDHPAQSAASAHASSRTALPEDPRARSVATAAGAAAPPAARPAQSQAAHNPATAVEPEPGSTGARASSAVRTTPRAKARRTEAVATRTPAATPAAPEPDCSVAYQIDERGIKRFKRECF